MHFPRSWESKKYSTQYYLKPVEYVRLKGYLILYSPFLSVNLGDGKLYGSGAPDAFLALYGAWAKARSYSQLGSRRNSLATTPICQGITL